MYDYIIIGAGSAGCVLANRLSEDPSQSVLLIEAGPKDKHPLIQIPAAFSKLFKTKLDWNYYTPPQPHAANRSLFLPRGKVAGGSSSINAMIYIRGHRQDYDDWAAGGNKGWGYDEILPYFIKSEGNEQMEDAFHGTDGPLNVADLREPFPITQAFVEGAQELGYAANDDFNGAEQEGFGHYQVTQINGKRCSAYRAFVKPILERPNLTVLTQTQVLRVVLEGRQAVGVECQLPTHIQEYKARHEVVLAAGAYNSPQLLMLSGIGPGQHLQEMELNVKHDLPGVGQNLQDHLIVPMNFANTDKHSLDRAETGNSFLRFLVWGDGPLSSNVAEGGGFVRTTPDLSAPDIQYIFAPAYFKRHGFERLSRGQGRGFSFGPTLLTPKSVGHVALTSPKAGQAPLIDHQYLSAQEDVDALVAGMEIGFDIAESKSLSAYLGGFLSPKQRLTNPDALEDYVRQEVQTLYHPAGTCKMGQDEMAVVDDRLRVHGLQGLRVVDASIMPQVVRGNTNAPTMMIAEKAADMILEDKGKRETVMAANASLVS